MMYDLSKFIGSVCRRLLHWGPLIALPLMLSLRWHGMVAPNEEPKWAVMLLLGLALGLAVLAVNTFGSRQDEIVSGWNSAGIALWLFFLGLALGAIPAVNIGEAWNRLAYWGAGGMVWWASVRSSRLGEDYRRHLQWSLAISGLIFAGEFWRSYWYEYPSPGYNVSLWFSPVGHVNFTADVLVVLIPLLVWTTMCAVHWGLATGAGLALASSLVMLLSGASRGGIGGLLVGATVMLLVLRLDRKPGLADLPQTRLLLLAACVLGAFVMHGQLSHKFRDMARLSASLSGSLQENQEKFHLDVGAPLREPLPPLAALWGQAAPWLGTRTPMWASTVGMIADAPWTGHGTGNFLFVYPKYGNRYPSFRDPLSREHSATTNPHNVLLQLAAENGIPLSLLFAGLYGWLLWRLLCTAREEFDPFWLCGLWAAVAAAFDAQFNHVFFNPASLFLFALGMGSVYGSLPVRLRPVSIPPLAPMEAGILGVSLLLFATPPMKGLVAEYLVARAQRLEGSRAPMEQIQLAYETALPWSPYQFRALYGAAVAAFQAGHLEQAENLIRRFLTVFPQHMNGWNLLGASLMKSGRYEAAERAYQRALEIFPDAAMVRANLEQARRLRGR